MEGCGLLWWREVVGDGAEGGRGEHRSGVDRLRKTPAGVDRFRKSLALCHLHRDHDGRRWDGPNVILSVPKNAFY